MESTLASDLAQAARAMADQPDFQATLDAICTQAVDAVRADACGLFLLRKGTVHSAALSTPELRAAEQAQLEADEGPCLDTLRHRRSVHVRDLRMEGRWPQWTPRMVDLGWLSVLSFPLAERNRTVGSLNLVARTAERFHEADVRAGQLFADHASVALSAARTESSLSEAVSTRHVIGVAQGILIERYDLDIDRAFEAMRRCSQESNVKLRSVAEHVVRHRRLPTIG